jgi:hypothetical protein
MKMRMAPIRSGSLTPSWPGFLARANVRKRRSLGGASTAERVGADRAAMGPLPPIDAATIGWRNSVILPRDYYVRLDTCDYPRRRQLPT